MEKNPIRGVDGGVRVDVLIVPNASRFQIVGLHGDRVKVRVCAPPDKGRANKEAMARLRAATGATRATLVSGAASRRKTIELSGVSVSMVRAGLIGDM